MPARLRPARKPAPQHGCDLALKNLTDDQIRWIGAWHALRVLDPRSLGPVHYAPGHRWSEKEVEARWVRENSQEQFASGKFKVVKKQRPGKPGALLGHSEGMSATDAYAFCVADHCSMILAKRAGRGGTAQRAAGFMWAWGVWTEGRDRQIAPGPDAVRPVSDFTRSIYKRAAGLDHSKIDSIILHTHTPGEVPPPPGPASCGHAPHELPKT